MPSFPSEKDTPMTRAKIDQLLDWIESAKHLLITAHKGPDGDSIGSSLALFHYLKQKKEEVFVCHPDKAPSFLSGTPGSSSILTVEEHPKAVEDHFAKADLIFCLDYNTPARIGKMAPLMDRSSAKKAMIDHHRDPDPTFCDLLFSDIAASSTSQLIYELIAAFADLDAITLDIGSALYTGIVTDTGSFQFSSTRPKTHRIVADLIERGVDHGKIHERVFGNYSLHRIQLNSYALLEKLVLLLDAKTAYLSLTAAELTQFQAVKGDTEGLVNQALAIQGVQLAVFLKEEEGIIKISFRSQGAIPVNELARHHFDGGGHLNASGGRFLGSMERAIQKLVAALPEFVAKHSDLFA